jgi:hypothetical protein
MLTTFTGRLTLAFIRLRLFPNWKSFYKSGWNKPLSGVRIRKSRHNVIDLTLLGQLAIKETTIINILILMVQAVKILVLGYDWTLSAF